MLGDTASTGIGELDLALGGLYWGDNVVWELEEGCPVEPFFESAARLHSGYQYAGYVGLASGPGQIAERYPGFEFIDARPGTALAQPAPLVSAIRSRCRANERDLLLFDPIDQMVERWGVEAATRFFTRTCPMLLELGAVAYWSFVPGEQAASLRREIEEVTQCVIAVGEGRLRIAKAEGRSFGVQGSVFRYRAGADGVVMEAAPVAARLGAALRAVRLQRHLSQSELARLAGVSPSAVSQAERGQRGLSLETLLDLTSRLNITLDELLRGEVAPGYRLARRNEPRRKADGRPAALLDDPQTGLRAYLMTLPPNGSGELGFAHKGVEIVAVASGLVQVVLQTGRPVLRPGEALLAEQSGITACRNLTDEEATVFWILRDETGERQTARPV
jgi:transcriptional regulator with XRE-family HTH domain